MLENYVSDLNRRWMKIVADIYHMSFSDIQSFLKIEVIFICGI